MLTTCWAGVGCGDAAEVETALALVVAEAGTGGADTPPTVAGEAEGEAPLPAGPGAADVADGESPWRPALRAPLAGTAGVDGPAEDSSVLRSLVPPGAGRAPLGDPDAEEAGGAGGVGSVVEESTAVRGEPVGWSERSSTSDEAVPGDRVAGVPAATVPSIDSEAGAPTRPAAGGAEPSPDVATSADWAPAAGTGTVARPPPASVSLPSPAPPAGPGTLPPPVGDDPGESVDGAAVAEDVVVAAGAWAGCAGAGPAGAGGAVATAPAVVGADEDGSAGAEVSSRRWVDLALDGGVCAATVDKVEPKSPSGSPMPSFFGAVSGSSGPTPLRRVLPSGLTNLLRAC